MALLGFPLVDTVIEISALVSTHISHVIFRLIYLPSVLIPQHRKPLITSLSLHRQNFFVLLR